jgi:N-acetylmuramoyl-L-alanine amidase
MANRAVAGLLSDPVHGATHYHAAGISPFWAKNEKPVAVIGRHIFYKLPA